MSFGSNLKSLRVRKGLTQKELGERVGVTEATIGNWERDIKTPNSKGLIAIVTTLGVSLDDLFGCGQRGVKLDLHVPTTLKETILIKQYQKLDVFGKQAVDAVCNIEYKRVQEMDTEGIPIYRRSIPYYWTPAAAGISTPIEGTDYEMITIDEDAAIGIDYAVKILGDSMLPYIEDGEIVYVNRDAEVMNGDVGIFCVDGTTYCKQYYKSLDETVFLLSANPTRENTNITLGNWSDSSFQFQGKVILNEKTPLPGYFIKSFEG